MNPALPPNLYSTEFASGSPVTVKTNTYTTNGQLATGKDAGSHVTTYGYDAIGRLLTTAYPNTTVASIPLGDEYLDIQKA